MATNSELKPCPTIGSKCRGCPDCPGASSTGFKSGEITSEAARQELELLAVWNRDSKAHHDDVPDVRCTICNGYYKADEPEDHHREKETRE